MNRFCETFGVALPIVQGGMSWASSNAALPAAVSNAGGLGVLAAGPMRIDDFRKTLAQLRQMTDRPFAVNLPLYRPNAEDFLDLVLDDPVPVLIASQGGPQKYVARARAAGIKTLHVVASVVHARKAADKGVDGIIAVGGEAGGHPPPSQVTTLVLTRAIAQACLKIPLVAAGGVADGFGIAAMLALGADGVQLGTRFLATRESTVHQNYKDAVLAAGPEDTRLVGVGMSPIRMLNNDFARRFLDAEQRCDSVEEREKIFAGSSLKLAAFHGDATNGKAEAGQSAGLINDLPSAGDLTRRLASEAASAIGVLAELGIALERSLACHDQSGF